MSNSPVMEDPELQQTLKSSDGGLAASVEAMKTRRAAQAMTKVLRDINPKLAKALIDDRDKVHHQFGMPVMLNFTVCVCTTIRYLCCMICKACSRQSTSMNFTIVQSHWQRSCCGKSCS